MIEGVKMQLLKITTSPMKYELEIEPSRLEYVNDHIPSADVSNSPSELKVETKNATVRIDTYEARKSLGILNTEDMFRRQAELCKDHIMQKTREYVEDGALMARIEDGVTIPQIMRQKIDTQPNSVTVFIPNTGADLTWEPPKVDIEYTKSELKYDWDEQQSSMRYIPGRVKMKIVEYASINVEYLGTPMYVPPSADPDNDNKNPDSGD